MIKYAKWIGLGLGFLVSGSPLGAAIGFLLGYVVDRLEGTMVNYSTKAGNQAYYSQSSDFSMSLVMLTGAVMQADGKVMRSELDYVKSFFVKHFGEEQSIEMVKMLKEVLQHAIDTREVAMQMRSRMAHPSRLQLLHFLFGIANADNSISPEELRLLHQIARFMGISQMDFQSVRAMFGFQYGRQSAGGGGSRQYTQQERQNNIGRAYEILEVSESATASEIKNAYRKMAKKHHPDRVASMGERFQQDAKEKFQKIQEAYEQIKRVRNIS